MRGFMLDPVGPLGCEQWASAGAGASAGENHGSPAFAARATFGGYARAGFALAALVLTACAAPPVETPDAVHAVVAAEDASHPTAAIGEDGTVYIAWVGSPDAEGRADVLLARSDDGGASYAAPVRVNHIPGDAAPHAQAPAQVVAGAGDVVYVLWQNNTPVEGRRFPASDLRFARSSDGGRTFEPAVFVNDDAGGRPTSHTFHDVAVLPDGTVLVSWIDGRARAAFEAAHGAMSASSVTAGSAGDGAGGSTLAAHGTDTHHGGQSAADPGPEIRVARSTDGGRTFGPSIVVAQQACPCCRTTLAIGPGGEVYLAWRAVFAGNIRDIVVARSDDGGRSFRPAAPVHDDGWRIDACPHAGPSLAVDPDGRLHAAWYTGNEGGSGLFYATSDDGGRTFGSPVDLATGDIVPPSPAHLARAGDGRIWIAFEDRTTAERRIRIAVADGDGGPEPIGVEAGTGAAPAIAARAGRVVVAWLDGKAVRSVALDAMR